MKRSSALLLLLLLPLTMAPRTSFIGGDYEISVASPRDTVKVGGSLPVTVTLTNVGSEPTVLQPLVMTLLINDFKDSPMTVRATSRGCMEGGTTVGCWVPPLSPDETTTLRLVVSPGQAGRLSLQVNSRDGSNYGTVAWTAVP